MNSYSWILGCALATVGTAIFSPPLLADKLQATLTGSSQVPPNTSAGVGTAEVSFDPPTKTMKWKITHSGLANVTHGHFHGPASVGKTGRVQITIVDAATSPASGVAVLSDQQASDLLNGRYYVNLHTYKYPAGEIRGQLIKLD